MTKTKVRVRKVRGTGKYKGQWCAAWGKSFMPFMYDKTLEGLMNRLAKRQHQRRQAH